MCYAYASRGKITYKTKEIQFKRVWICIDTYVDMHEACSIICIMISIHQFKANTFLEIEMVRLLRCQVV